MKKEISADSEEVPENIVRYQMKSSPAIKERHH